MMELTDKSKKGHINELLRLRQLNNFFRERFNKYMTFKKTPDGNVSSGNEELRKAYLSIPDPVIISRLSDGKFVLINKGFTKLTGYTEEDVIGKKIKELNLWVDRECYNTLKKSISEKGAIENLETDFIKKDGSITNGLMSASLIDFDGSTCILCTTKDITFLKKAGEAQSQEKLFIDALMNNLEDYIYIKDRESRFLKINKSHACLLGLDDPDQVTGKTDYDFYPKEEAMLAYEDEQAIINSGQPMTREEMLTMSDDKYLWVLTTKVPLFDNEGNIIGTFGISKNISEKKKSEEQLFLLANALKSISESVSITDMNDKVLFLNESFLKTYGYNEDELKGKIIDIIRSPKNPPELVDEILPASREGGWSGEILNQRKDGSEFPVFLSTSVIRNDNKQPIALIGVAQDITKLKTKEEAITKISDMLKITLAERDKFFSILAHDLRGPLSAFVDVTQILSQEIQTMDKEEIREITMSMKKSATNIYNLLDNLLEWSRLSRGGMDFNPEKSDLKKSIRLSIEILSESANEKDIDIAIEIPDKTEIFADSHMFDAIIRNLVSNAVKFTPHGGKVCISTDSGDDRLCKICVSDSGIGMTSELRDKLFLLNERTSREGTDGEPSTGLGLLLCKEFVEKHGGTIWVESEVGKGSKFCFTISTRS